MTFSVVMITRDAEDVIGGALESVNKIADEIVVVDSQSSDNTLSIVKRFTHKIYTQPFDNDFSRLRNYALSKAGGEWVLSLDADERLSKPLLRAIPSLIKRKDVDGYWLRRRTFLTSEKYLRWGLFYPDWQLRLFRHNPAYRWEGAVHEQLNIPKEKTQESELNILHYPQHPKYDAFTSFANLVPYIKMAAAMYAKKDNHWLYLVVKGTDSFFRLFFGGFFRGKGFLDGWAGLRSHFMFATAVALGYFWGAWNILRRNYAIQSI